MGQDYVGTPDWQQTADQHLKETFETGSSPWFATSMLRPSNLKLWYDMKSKLPVNEYDSPKGYDDVMAAYEKRLKRNEQVGGAVKADPSVTGGNTVSPWLMMQSKPQTR